MDVKDAYSRVSVENRIIIVTGGGSGIGEATAKLLAARGAAVMIADINEESGNKTLTDIKKAGCRAAFKRTDVANEADVEALVAETVSKFGGLYGAFNNAAISDRSGPPISEVSLSDWQQTIGVDLTGVFFCIKHEIVYMVKHGGGSIVNTTSAAGLVGLPFSCEYVAAKHGVVGLTRASALEFSSKGIRVNAVAPGCIETPALKPWMDANPDGADLVRRNHPIGRFGQPGEIAEMVAWLLSDAASFVTGAIISADGGYTAL